MNLVKRGAGYAALTAMWGIIMVFHGRRMYAASKAYRDAMGKVRKVGRYNGVDTEADAI